MSTVCVSIYTVYESVRSICLLPIYLGWGFLIWTGACVMRDILSKWKGTLLSVGALFIKEIAPVLNTKDEYRSRTLTLKF